jgi:23S rRNA (uracil1939-C5)-methyltransferase
MDPDRPGPPPPGEPTGADILVEISALAPGGDAVGRQLGGAAEGRVTFVPLAAPGELVRARLVRTRARVAWAELIGVERASPTRVVPPCPLFGRCGGCQWQHVEAAEQRRAKGAFVSRALGIEVGEARPVGPDYGYRERARLSVARGAGQTAIGFSARRTHEVVDVPACLLLVPPLARALPLIRAQAAGAADGEQVPVQAGREGEVAWRLGGRLWRLPPQATAAAEAADPDDPAAWPDVSDGSGTPLRVPPGGFAQVGQAANAALVAAVGEAVGADPGQVLELFAGSGNFTRLLVQRSPAVVASDGDRAAVARGRRNVPAARWVAPHALPAAPADTVVVDPPREGLDAASLDRAASARRRLIYVSCDPQTLGRDRSRLQSRGFRLHSAVALDLMPQTHHVEVVAVFVPAAPSAPSR